MKISMLDGPDGDELKERLAQMLSEACTREQIATAFGISADTVTDWRKRQDVAQRVHKIIMERSDRILSHTDTKIIKVLESNKRLTVRELLEIRRTFAGEKLEITTDGERGKALTELMEKLDSDPELAESLEGALSSSDE